MNYGDGGLSASDVALLTNGRNNSTDSFGNGDNAWWIIIFLIFAFLGWGRNGFGGNDGNGGAGNMYGFGFSPCCTPATQQGLSDAFNFSQLDNGVRSLANGLCDGFYAVNTSILNLGQSLLNCCCEIKTGIMQNGYETREAINMNSNAIQNGICNLGYKLQDCCCQTQRAIDGVNYNMATQACDTRNTIQSATRDILESNNNNTRAILDFLTQDKISTLQSENQTLKFQASQTNQNAVLRAAMDANTAEIIRRTGNDCPIPAYVVPNPNCCYNYNVTSNNCGCNCGNY